MVYYYKRDPTRSNKIKQGNIQPIYFLSRILSAVELNYQPIELEIARIIQAITKVRYIINIVADKTIIFIDYLATTSIVYQTSLRSTSTDKINIRLVRVSQYLFQFALNIRYKPSKQYIVLDTLSRLTSRHPLYRRSLDKIITNSIDTVLPNTEIVYAYTSTFAEISIDFKDRLKSAYQGNKFQSERLATL